MERYNKQSPNGRIVISRFCRCGHSAILATRQRDELLEFEQLWADHRVGAGHETVDFDHWIEFALRPPLKLVYS